MKIPFNYVFKELNGDVIPEQPEEEIVEKDGKKSKKTYPPFTLKTACVNILSGVRLEQLDCPKCGFTIRPPEQLDGMEKCRRFKLARKIYDSKDGLVDLGVDDIKLLKTLLAKNHPSNLIVGQAWEILDPHGAKDK